MEYLCGFAVLLVAVTGVGHGIWVAVAALFSSRVARHERPFRHCPACGFEISPHDFECGSCALALDSPNARALHRVRVATRAVREMRDADQLDADTTAKVIEGLETRTRKLRGTHERPPRAVPVAHPVAPPAPEPLPEAPAARAEPEPLPPVAAPEPFAAVPAEPPPKRAGFLEEHNILWGELVGGLLIVGCSIALVVTLRETLEAIPYFRFLLSALVALALFGAGEYTLHRWKLAGTSRGMLVIALLLVPLTLLLLGEQFSGARNGPLDVGVKLAALAAFVAVVRTGGRDLIHTEHLPGPIDRRWLLALGVVGPPAAQLLPLDSPWPALACFAVACAATLGGLTWYRSARRDEPVSNDTGTALLVFVGLCGFALAAAWGPFAVRVSFAALALPVAVAALPLVEAGALVHRRATGSAGLRTAGTAVALGGFVALTGALALAWPDALPLFGAALAGGAYLLWLAFRERLPWVQVGAVPLLAFAAVVGFHSAAANWTAGPRAALFSGETGAVLAACALALALFAEGLARRASRQTRAILSGAVALAALALATANTFGANAPALAAGTHFALAAGALAANARWLRQWAAHAALFAALAGLGWSLHAAAPGAWSLWGFAFALASLALSALALALKHRHAELVALVRRAARDAALGASALALGTAALSLTVRADWHTGTLFALAGAGFALARLTGSAVATFYGGALALLGGLHLALHTVAAEPLVLAGEVALLTHTSFATLAAHLARHQKRVFAWPLRWCARVSSALAIPLLLFAPAGFAPHTAALALWLACVWLAFALLWREAGGFTLFQAGATLAALLTGFAWIERQEWWAETGLRHFDPRAVEAFGLALTALAMLWAVARRAAAQSVRARELWCDNPLSLDRLAFAGTVLALAALAFVAVVPAARAELLPKLYAGEPELAHAFGPAALALLAALTGAVLLSWRLSTLPRDAGPHAVALAVLLTTGAALTAGTFAPQIATATALRWSLALAFALGTLCVALRVPLVRFARASGFPTEREPWLKPTLLALVAVPAVACALLSWGVANIAMEKVAPGGPVAGSLFHQIGATRGFLVPLAVLVCGLAVTAARERSGGYALAGGLQFVAVVCAAYQLSLVIAGEAIGGAEHTRTFVYASAAAALWALLWRAAQTRVPSGRALTVQVSVAAVAVGFVALIVTGFVFDSAGDVLPARFDALGSFGWIALALTVAAWVWHAPRGAAAALAFGGLTAGALAAVSVREWDAPFAFLSFHALALVWLGTAAALLALSRRRAFARALAVVANGLLLCAVRASANDPWTWFAPVLALAAAVAFGAVAVRFRRAGFAVASVLAQCVAATAIWGPLDSGVVTLACYNAAALAVGFAVWSRVRATRERPWPDADFALVPTLLLLAGSVLVTVTLPREAVPPAVWVATALGALGAAVGLWDRFARLARPALYAAGVAAVLLGVAAFDARPVWNADATAPALAGFVLLASALALAAARGANPLRIPEHGDFWTWLLGAQLGVACAAGALGLQNGLRAAELADRLLFPGALVLLSLGCYVTTRAVPRAAREWTRAATVALSALACGATAWAVPDPAGPFVWLHRNGWLFVSFAAFALVTSECAPRLADRWRGAVRGVGGCAAALAGFVLLVCIVQQVPAFDPAVRRTPLHPLAGYLVLAGVAALAYLALRFAVQPTRDPFEVPERRRGVYVYLAELLLVLAFVHVRLNVPELFFGNVAKYWTFALMALAYAGIGLSELFSRRKLEVLAAPLRRTGVLLPLVPLLAFWAKPPEALTEFAHGAAPGLAPLLAYLEKLPQHFDTYAWLWFLAGGAYALLALWRRSFGWALLAALATNAATWALLAHTAVPFAIHPQAWVIPLALIVLVSEHVNRHRLRPEVSNGMRYAAVALVYVASAADVFIAGVGNSTWLPVLLALFCVSGVVAGVLLRVPAFAYLGVAFLLLDVFAMIWHAAVNLNQTWVWYASGIALGAAVLGLFAYLEKRKAAKGPRGDSAVSRGERPA